MSLWASSACNVIKSGPYYSLQIIFHLWWEVDHMGKQQMVPFSFPYDFAHRCLICENDFLVKGVMRTVAPFVLPTFHSDFLGALFYPQDPYSAFSWESENTLL